MIINTEKKTTQEVLAWACSLSRGRIAQLCAEGVLDTGMPIPANVKRLEQHRLDRQAKQIAEQFQTTYDSDEELARLRHHQANLAELEEGRQRGDLMAVEDVATWLGERIGSMRSKLLGLPTKAAHAAVNATTIQEIEDILGDYVREALEEIQDVWVCQSQFADRADSASGGQAAPEVDDKPVGGPRADAEPGIERRAGKVAH